MSRRSIRIAWLSAALVAATAALTAWAQVIDSTPCERSCYEKKAACVSACGEHPDPIECEGGCEDALEDCVRQCR